jgi:hypothetical protein
MRWEGSDASLYQIEKWLQDMPHVHSFSLCRISPPGQPGGTLELKTDILELECEPGDWLIVNDNGVLFMCNDPTFQERYVPEDTILDPEGGSHENPLGEVSSP